MSKEKFYLIFSDKPNSRVQINEPIGFGDIDFSCDQKENGLGRDVTLSGGVVPFKFTVYRHDESFDKLLYFNHYYGFESDVKLIIVLEDGQEFIGELDFYTAQTNDFNYFECSVILESALQIFKRRSETKVDLFSNKDINGDYIKPLQPINMLLQAKPSLQISEWTQPISFNDQLTAQTSTNLFREEFFQINPIQNLILSGVQDSYTFFTTKEQSPDQFTDSFFKVLTAQSTLKNVVINISGVSVFLETSASIGSASVSGFAEFSLKIAKGIDFSTAEKTMLFTTKLTGDAQTYAIDNNSFNNNVGDVERGQSIWIWYDVKVHTPGTPSFSSSFTLDVSLPNEAKMQITTNSVAYNSITPTFRLIDVMKHIAKSISGLEVNAPRYDLGGEFYDNVITNGKLLGGNINDPFYVSWEDIGVKSINPEHNGDSEIQLDGRVFQGIYEDYHRPVECAFFDTTQFSGMVKKPNPLYCINKFVFKYSKYQSLKEATEPNSESTIHGESQLTPYNQKVENSKECSVDWTRDAILLDVQQRLSTKVSTDTATQDDDTIFVIDTIATTSDHSFTESTMMQHTYTADYLSLRNNGEVNFIVLGIKVGSPFAIEYPDLNAGVYNVLALTNTELQLVKTSGGSISSANDGLRLTKYTYTIEQETTPLTNRTNEDFTTVNNLISPDKYSNLRYSVQRDIRNFWDAYLATVNMYWKDKFIKNTYYKNNGKCETEYNGLRVVEKEDFIPTTEPLVTPFMYESVVFANVDFSDFILLQNNIRSLRGFIRTIDNNKRVLKLFPIKMSYQNKSRQLTITGQEKFEKAYLTIEKQNGIITVNSETKLRKLIYTVDEGNKVVLYDLERFRLYNGIYWDKVSVNGAIAPTLEILKEWLDLLG